MKKSLTSTHPFDWGAGSARHAKVRQLDLATLSVKDQDVLRLDVPVDQLLTVQVVQSNSHLMHTALCHSFRKTHLREQGAEKI